MKTLTLEIKNEVKELTHYNMHTEARILICESLVLEELAEKYNEIKYSQERKLELSEEDYQKRIKLDKDLYKLIDKETKDLL